MEATFMHLRGCLAGNEKGLRLCHEVYEHLRAREEEEYLRRMYTLDLEHQVADLKQRLGEHVPSGEGPRMAGPDAYRLDDCTNLLPETRPAFSYLSMVWCRDSRARGALNDIKTQVITFDTRLRARQTTDQQGEAAPDVPHRTDGSGADRTSENQED